MQRKPDRTFRLGIIGTPKAGVSSLITSEAGGDYFPLSTRIYVTDDKEVGLDFVDKFDRRPPTLSIEHGVHVVIFVFELSGDSFFNQLDKNIEDFYSNYKQWHPYHNRPCSNGTVAENPPIVLVGNKSDIAVPGHVTDSMVRGFIIENQEKYNIRAYIPVSAKTGEGVKSAFNTAVEICMQPVRQKSEEEKNERDDLRQRLQTYNQRIASYRNNYAFGFWVFKRSRAINRVINQMLCQRLMEELNYPHKGLKEIFSSENIMAYHAEIVGRYFRNKPGFVDRGINSSELNAIIRDVQNAAVSAERALGAKPNKK